MENLAGVCPICRKVADRTDLVIPTDIVDKPIFLHRKCAKFQFDNMRVERYISTRAPMRWRR